MTERPTEAEVVDALAAAWLEHVVGPKPKVRGRYYPVFATLPEEHKDRLAERGTKVPTAYRAGNNARERRGLSMTDAKWPTREEIAREVNPDAMDARQSGCRCCYHAAQDYEVRRAYEATLATADRILALFPKPAED